MAGKDVCVKDAVQMGLLRVVADLTKDLITGKAKIGSSKERSTVTHTNRAAKRELRLTLVDQEKPRGFRRGEWETP